MSSQVLKNQGSGDPVIGSGPAGRGAGGGGAGGGEPERRSGRPEGLPDGAEARVQLTVIPGGISEPPPADLRAAPAVSSPAFPVAAAEGTGPAAEPAASAGAAASAASSSSGIRIRLENFDGPMDLFLHLVQQQEVDISRVSMKLVAEQYLGVVDDVLTDLEADSSLLVRYDLEQISEYLVIAATLTAIKSSAVLPSASTDGLLENVEPMSEEFLEELRERLRQYEVTKRRASALLTMPQLGVDTFQRLDRKALLPTPEMLQEADDPRSLGEHLTRLLKRIGALGNVFRVRLEPLSIVSSMMKIVDVLGSKLVEPGKSFSFRGILGALRQDRPLKDASGAKTLVIGSFLAVLELIKRGLLNAVQPDDASDIEISLRSAAAGADEAQNFSSEFDEVPQPSEVNRVF